MIEYKLSRGVGHIIKVDDEDAWLLNFYKVNTMQSLLGNTRYVVLSDKKTRKYVGLLHRIIMKTPQNKETDHKNGDGLDCRKDNLREATNSQNQFNRKLSVNKVKGVWYREDRGRWAARLNCKGKLVLNKLFATEAEAVAARLTAEEEFCEGYQGLGTDQPRVMGYTF